MKNFVIVGALALSLGGLAAPAFAEPARAAGSAAHTDFTEPAAPVVQAETQRYCIVDTPTGSHIRHKECKTRTDWLKEGFDPLARK